MSHSLVSGKKEIFEDGNLITTITAVTMGDFSHGWTSNGYIFRIEINNKLADADSYQFTIDGIPFSRWADRTTAMRDMAEMVGAYDSTSENTKTNATVDSRRNSANVAPASNSAGNRNSFQSPSAAANDPFAFEPAPATATAAGSPTAAPGLGGFDPFAPAAASPGPAPAYEPNTSFDPFGGPAPAASGGAGAFSEFVGAFSEFDEAPRGHVASAVSIGSDPFGGAGSSDPFGSPAAISSDPFGAPAAAPSSDPFSAGPPPPTLVTSSDPFRAPDAATSSDPFGIPAAAMSSDPFGAPAAASSDPFGAPAAATSSDPFGAPATASSDPFGSPAAVSSYPFGSPAAAAASHRDSGGLIDSFAGMSAPSAAAAPAAAMVIPSPVPSPAMGAPVAQQKQTIFDGLVNLDLTGGAAGTGPPAATTGYGYGAGSGIQQLQSLDMMMGSPGSGPARRMSTGINMGANAGLGGMMAASPTMPMGGSPVGLDPFAANNNSSPQPGFSMEGMGSGIGMGQAASANGSDSSNNNPFGYSPPVQQAKADHSSLDALKW